MSIHIEGRRWWDRVNTYHSVTIYKDGEVIAYIPYSYGGMDMYLQTAWDWLGVNGWPELAERNPYTNGYVHFGTQYLREVLHGTCSVVDVSRKKDL